MRIGITAIAKSTVEGTDANIVKFIDFMQDKSSEKITDEYLADLKDGAYKYLQAVTYQGSQSVIFNLEGLLKAPNEQEMRACATQWKAMEEVSWEVKEDE